MSSNYVSMTDIARRAGVSKNTVSLALRDSPRVTPERKAYICEIALAMGYRVDPTLSELMSKMRVIRTAGAPANVAVVLGCGLNGGPSLTQFLQGVKAEAKVLSYGLETYLAPEWGNGEALCRVLSATGVKGVFLCHYTARQGFHLDWNAYSWIVFGRCQGAPEFARVAPATYEITKQVLMRLSARGYTRFGFAPAPDVRKRWLGAFIGNVYHKMSPVIPPLGCDDWSRKTFLRWLKCEKPDVVLSLDDKPLEWMREAGMQVPEEIGFVHLNAGVSRHKSTGMDLEAIRSGTTAMRAMDAQLRHHDVGIPACPVVYSMPGRWIEGETTRGAPKLTN